MHEKIDQLLNPEEESHWGSQAISWFLVVLISANALMSILETVPGLTVGVEGWLWRFEVFSITLFAVEYFLRLWSCTARGYSPILGRIRYALTPMMLIDLAAIIPFFLLILNMDLRMARVVRLTRLFRVAKLVRHSKALRLLGRTLWMRRDELVVTLVIGGFAMILSASAVYYAEHQRQPDVFSSIPASLWWAVSTLTTVGYGDTYPVTVLGKILGGIIQVIGVGLFAMPAGILASGFIQEYQEQKDGAQVCPHCGREIHPE